MENKIKGYLKPGEQLTVLKDFAKGSTDPLVQVAGTLLNGSTHKLRPFESVDGMIRGKDAEKYLAEVQEALQSPDLMFDMPTAIPLNGSCVYDDEVKQLVHSKASFIETLISNEKIFATLNFAALPYTLTKVDPANGAKYANVTDIYGSKYFQARNAGYIISGDKGIIGQKGLKISINWSTEDGHYWTSKYSVSPTKKEFAIAVFPVTAINQFNTVMVGICTDSFESVPGYNHHIIVEGLASDAAIMVTPIHVGTLRKFFSVMKKAI